MSYIIPFLTYPFEDTIRVYQEIGYEFSLFLPGNRIKAEIQPFLDKEKLRKDLIIAEDSNSRTNSTIGTNLFINGDAVVLLIPGFHDKDKEACRWVLKHEISHIKNNDRITKFLVSSISFIAAAIFGMRTMSWFFSTLFTNTVSSTAHTLFTLWRESKADDFAIENSSNDELLGGRRFLITSQQVNLHKRRTFGATIAISSDGNDLFDSTHPSLTSRIKKIEKVLEKRGIVVNKEEEDRKIESLKLFMMFVMYDSFRTFRQFVEIQRREKKKGLGSPYLFQL